MTRRVLLLLAVAAAVTLGGIVAYGQLATGASPVPSPVTTADESANEPLSTPPPEVAADGLVHGGIAIDGPDIAGAYECVADAVVKIRGMRVVEVQEASTRVVDVGQAVVSPGGTISDTPEGAYPGMPVHYTASGTLRTGWRECQKISGYGPDVLPPVGDIP